MQSQIRVTLECLEFFGEVDDLNRPLLAKSASKWRRISISYFSFPKNSKYAPKIVMVIMSLKFDTMHISRVVENDMASVSQTSAQELVLRL